MESGPQRFHWFMCAAKTCFVFVLPEVRFGGHFCLIIRYGRRLSFSAGEVRARVLVARSHSLLQALERQHWE
jgi:hypothetical protein